MGVADCVEELRRYLEGHPKVVLAFLFGSMSRERARAGSDVKIALSAADLPVPETYRDSMLQLGVAGILEADLADEMAEMARLRNVLAHQYPDIRWESLRAFIEGAPDTVRRFIDAVERLVS